MRYYLTVILMLIAGTCSLQAQPRQVIIVKPLENYFLDNKVKLDKGVNCMVVKKKADFDKLFGIAKTATNTVNTPDFTKEMVLVLAMPPTNKEVVLTYANAIKAGDFIEVYCKVKRKAPPMTYTMQHLAVGIIPKYPEIKVVKFYDERMHLLGMVKLK